MKRASVVALLVLAAGLAVAAQNRTFISPSSPAPSVSSQVSSTDRGVPASVTSQSPQRTFISVPPSVTSFGNGFPPQCAGTGPLIPSAMGCTDPRFTGGPVNLRPRFSHTFPIYVPYPYPVYVEDQPAVQEVQEPDPPAPTIFEHRASVVPVRPARAAAAADSDSGSTPPSLEQSGTAREQVPTILIFRDGHQTEVLNYAIVGQTLYDLGTFVAHKIPLSDLDLKGTIKANEERGVDFSLPASTKVD